MNKAVLVSLASATLAVPSLAQDATRAYTAELLSDSANRTSFQGGGGAGHDGNGFGISDGSGANALYIGGAVSFRYTMNFRDEDAGDNSDFTHGFNTPNTRLWAWGHVWDKSLTYYLQFWAGDAGEWALEDAWGEYAFDGGLAVRWGQMTLPILREEYIVNEKQLAVDRSAANEVFNQDYNQGVQLTYTGEKFRVLGAFTDGIRTANTDFDSGAEADYALTARVDFMPVGADWNRFLDFTSFRSQDNASLIGAAIHWQDSGETGGTASPGSELLLYTVDASFEGKGWNVYGAFIGQSTEVENGGGDSDNFGGILQGGVFVSDQVELFARWDAIFWDDQTTDLAGEEVDDSHFLTAGANYYISPESHAVKLTGEVVWAMNQTDWIYTRGDEANSIPPGPLGGNTYNALLGNPDDGEFALRFQMQVVF
ncbi:MAG: hypothetical protein ACOYN0_03560 [Phycisphaerales bacterium]